MINFFLFFLNRFRFFLFAALCMIHFMAGGAAGATKTTRDYVRFSWSPISNVTSYHFQVSDRADFSNLLVDERLDRRLPTYLCRPPLPEGTIHARVRGRKKTTGLYGPFVRLEPVVIEEADPDPRWISDTPDSLSGVTVDPRPTFSWSPIPNVTSYQFQAGDQADFSGLLIDERLDRLVTSHTPDFDLPDGTIYARVRGRKKTTGLYGPFVQMPSVVIDTTPPGADDKPVPEIFPGDATSDQTPAFIWSPPRESDDVVAYRLAVRGDHLRNHFTVGDILNFSALIQKINDPDKAVSQYVKGKFSSSGKTLLNAYQGSRTLSGPEKRVIAGNLNNLLDDPDLYSEERFPMDSLTPEIRWAMVGNPGAKDLQLSVLNRRLLEYAFQEEIIASSAVFSDLMDGDRYFFINAVIKASDASVLTSSGTTGVSCSVSTDSSKKFTCEPTPRLTDGAFYARVSAIDPFWNEGPLVDMGWLLVDTVPPGPPQNTGLSVGSDPQRPKFSWDPPADSSDVKDYEVLMADSPSFDADSAKGHAKIMVGDGSVTNHKTAIRLSCEATSNSYQCVPTSDLSSGTIYAKVRAVDGAENPSSFTTASSHTISAASSRRRSSSSSGSPNAQETGLATTVGSIDVGMGIEDQALFKDPHLAAAIREALGVEEGSPIARGDLATLESLDISEREVTDFSGLENAVRLFSLTINLSQASELWKLSDLESLREVIIE
ncbi:exported hypothetical protein [Candidatus Desulfarcum epimagneticum]|uniref:Fibronectin type-III domain-containing protein n=1 Tax=uncultured Desulfobacteraceae bacterium TaxID=218296 RepID=A0A484HDS4_9BACT|nr:exported hypothetical protein [uncultured Desulfobacteraceae bacterium]